MTTKPHITLLPTILAAVAMAVLCLSSCQKAAQPAGGYMTVTANFESLSEGATRGTPFDSAAFTTDGRRFRMGVYVPGSDAIVGGAPTCATYNGSIWSLDQSNYYWDPAATYDFYGFYPSDLNPTVTNSSKSFYYTYAMATGTIDPVNQQDQMFAFKSQNGSNPAVSLHFYHTLSAINVVSGTPMSPMTIKSIRLNNLYTSGKCTVDRSVIPPTTSSLKWADYNNRSSYYHVFGSSISIHQSDTDVPIVTGDKTFMLIPQRINPDDPVHPELYLGVHLAGADRDTTISCSLPSTEWLPGYKYTYVVTFDGSLSIASLEAARWGGDAQQLYMSEPMNY